MSPDVLSPEQLETQGRPVQGSAIAALPAPVSVDGINLHALTSTAQLQAIRQEWLQLASATADPNPFYDPVTFLPAVEFLSATPWQIATFWLGSTQQGSGRLIGLIPLVQKWTGGPLPIRYWSLVKHDYSFLTTPLIASGFERACLDALLTYLREQTRPGILEFPLLNADGPVYSALIDVVRDRQQAVYRIDEYSRASLRRTEESAEEYIKKSIGGHSLREYRRHLRRLGDLGSVEFRSMTAETAGTWSEWFLDLEGSGWKGTNGTAFTRTNLDQNFFRNTVRDGAIAGTTEMSGLFLNGEPIALKCNLLSPPGSYAFKIAYSEDYARYSPGIQLELENIRTFWNHSQLDWMDSCAVPRHFMINRLWMERRPIQHLLVSTGRLQSELLLSVLPLIRASSRVVRRSLSRITQSFSREKFTDHSLRRS